ncbi:hypothetical protein GQ457_18G025920 [Hibiscus cannabinus]
MGDVFRSTDEKNSDVQIWSEGEQQWTAIVVNRIHIRNGGPNLCGGSSQRCLDAKSCVGQLGPRDEDTFKTDYGISRVLESGLYLLHFGNVDLVPTIEEYLALIHCPKIDRVGFTPSQNRTSHFGASWEGSRRLCHLG